MPTFALNFYNPAVAEQLRTGRKTATIRLGDKSAKYRKGMIVTVLCGARYGQRERIFDAVIDKVEVKALRELSPREIEHDNPQIRRVDEMVWFLSQLYNREVGEDDIVTLIRFSQITNSDAARSATGLANRRAEELGGSRIGAPHSSHSTANADAIGASQAGQRCRSSPPHCGHAAGNRPRRRGSSAGCDRTSGRTRPSRRASSGAPPGSSFASAWPPPTTVKWRPTQRTRETTAWPYAKQSPWARSRK